MDRGVSDEATLRRVQGALRESCGCADATACEASQWRPAVGSPCTRGRLFLGRIWARVSEPRKGGCTLANADPRRRRPGGLGLRGATPRDGISVDYSEVAG